MLNPREGGKPIQAASFRDFRVVPRGLVTAGLGRRIVAVSTLAFVWLGLPLGTYLGWGKPLAEKLLTSYVMPVGLAWHLLIVCSLFAVFRGSRTTARLLLSAVLALTLVGNSTLKAIAIGNLEGRFKTLSPADFSGPFRAIVMLGGCAYRLPSGRVEVNGEGQRVVTTAEFWHAGKTHWIVTTGAMPTPDSRDAALVGRDVLESLGVPPDHILRVPGRNTKEEIAAIHELLANPPENFARIPGEIGLVTSAFHMPRAMRLASASGLDLVPLPSGHHASPVAWNPTHLVPTAHSIDDNSILLREYLARLVGR